MVSVLCVLWDLYFLYDGCVTGLMDFLFSLCYAGSDLAFLLLPAIILLQKTFLCSMTKIFRITCGRKEMNI